MWVEGACLKGKSEGGLAVLDGGQEAGNVEGGRHLQQVCAAQPADGVPSLHLHMAAEPLMA